MTIAHTYLALRDEMLGVSGRYLALAAQLAPNDSIMANRLRLMAALGLEIVKSTEQRIRGLAAAGGEEANG